MQFRFFGMDRRELSNEFIFDIPISEKDLLELLPQKVYNMAG